MFWLGGACDIKEALKGIVSDVETALQSAAELA
jgi:hypothetical protein